MVGTGATGSWLLSMLTQLLANLSGQGHTLTIIDGDVIEDKNLINQHYIKKDVGKFKAEVLCDRYSKVYSNLEISYLPEYIKNKERLISLLETNKSNVTSMLVSCVDNNASRKIMHEVFKSKDLVQRLIYVDSGNSIGDDRIGQIVVGYKDYDFVQDTSGGTNCYKTKKISKVILSPVADVFPEILKSRDKIDKVLSCSYHSQEAPQNIGTNIMAATLLFNILNNIIAFNEITSHIVYFDAKKVEAISR